MSGRQVIVTTVFGSGANRLGETFTSFLKIPDTELHVFVYGDSLPTNPLPGLKYHLVKADPQFVSTRRDALFRRWTWPDSLDAEFALVVDGTDVICLRELPRFEKILRGAGVAGATEWGLPVKILGQGYTSTYINGGVTFWHLPSSKVIREEIVARGRARFRGEYDDQTVLNEVIHTKYFDQLVVLPSQYNWRALYKRDFRGWQHHWRAWPRRDNLDGVYLYHNNNAVREVLQDYPHLKIKSHAELPTFPQDQHPLSKWEMFKRKLAHRWHHA